MSTNSGFDAFNNLPTNVTSINQTLKNARAKIQELSSRNYDPIQDDDEPRKTSATCANKKDSSKPKLVPKKNNAQKQSTNNERDSLYIPSDIELAVLTIVIVFLIISAFLSSNVKTDIATIQVADEKNVVKQNTKEDIGFIKPPKAGAKSSKYVLTPGELRWEYKQQIVIKTIKQHAKSEVALRELKKMQREYNLHTGYYSWYDYEREDAKRTVENMRQTLENEAKACVDRWNTMTESNPEPFYKKPKGKSNRNKPFTLAELRWLHKMFIMSSYMSKRLTTPEASNFSFDKYRAFCNKIDNYMDSEGCYWFSGNDDSIAKKQVSAKLKSIEKEAQQLIDKWETIDNGGLME